MDNVV